MPIEQPTGLHLVEAKAGTTASSSLFGGVRRARQQLGPAAGEGDLTVVYGGDQPQHRSAGRLVPWAELHEDDW